MRPARSGDARACLSIVAEAAAERPRTLALLEDEMWTVREWRRHRLNWGRKGVWLVAELGGDLVGQLTCDRAGRPSMAHTAEFGITVAARARGQGVGRAMLETLETWTDEVGVTRIGLGVFADNARARALYEHLGYVQEGRERRMIRFPEGDVDIIRMAKQLDARGGEARDYDERSSEEGR